MTAKYANDFVVSLLSEPIWTFIHTKIPDIYLLSDVCEAFLDYNVSELLCRRSA